jgi:hypothetical protein
MQKFKFVFRVITSDETIIDQNIIQFTFINYGVDSDVVINNQLFIPSAQAGQTPNFFSENLGAGEKTATGYKVRFVTKQNGVNRLQMIQKVLVAD